MKQDIKDEIDKIKKRNKKLYSADPDGQFKVIEKTAEQGFKDTALAMLSYMNHPYTRDHNEI